MHGAGSPRTQTQYLILESLAGLVVQAMECDDRQYSDKLLAQNEMLQAVENGVVKVSTRLDKRLAQLPLELRSERYDCFGTSKLLYSRSAYIPA